MWKDHLLRQIAALPNRLVSFRCTIESNPFSSLAVDVLELELSLPGSSKVLKTVLLLLNLLVPALSIDPLLPLAVKLPL